MEDHDVRDPGRAGPAARHRAAATAAAVDRAGAGRGPAGRPRADRPRRLLGVGRPSSSAGRRRGTPCAPASVDDFRYFDGGRINVADNCVDRWAEDPATADRAAVVWEGEPGDTRTVTYAELADEVSALAAGLLALGVSQGRRRGDLHAQPRRGVHRDPRLQPDRRDLHGAVLRFRRGGRRLAARRRRGRTVVVVADAIYRRGQAGAAARDAARGPGRRPDRAGHGRRATAPATPCRSTEGEHSYAARAGGRRRRHARGAARPQRAVVPDLHQRHRVEAQGRGAQRRRVPARDLGERALAGRATRPATSTGWPPTSAG